MIGGISMSDIDLALILTIAIILVSSAIVLWLNRKPEEHN